MKNLKNIDKIKKNNKKIKNEFLIKKEFNKKIYISNSIINAKTERLKNKKRIHRSQNFDFLKNKKKKFKLNYNYDEFQNEISQNISIFYKNLNNSENCLINKKQNKIKKCNKLIDLNSLYNSVLNKNK